MNVGLMNVGSCAVHVACPDCDEVIELSVPIVARIEREAISVSVDNSVEWQQPVWDHALSVHGPRLIEG